MTNAAQIQNTLKDLDTPSLHLNPGRPHPGEVCQSGSGSLSGGSTAGVEGSMRGAHCVGKAGPRCSEDTGLRAGYRFCFETEKLEQVCVVRVGMGVGGAGKGWGGVENRGDRRKDCRSMDQKSRVCTDPRHSGSKALEGKWGERGGAWAHYRSGTGKSRELRLRPPLHL